MKNTLFLLFGLPIMAFAAGIKKLQDLKSFIKTLVIRLDRIYDIKLDVLNNQASFLADFTVSNPTDKIFDLQSAGLITLKRILFYDLSGKLIASALIDVSSILIDKGKSIRLLGIPFETSLTGGISKLQKYLKNKNSKDLLIELEIQAFNKIYKTGLK
jgi:hypothetical protein